jgi:hypothetical protein
VRFVNLLPRTPARRLSLAGVTAFVLAAVVDTAKGSEDFGESTWWDTFATILVLVGVALLLAGALVLLRFRTKRAETSRSSRPGLLWAASAVWMLGVVSVYLGSRNEDGRDGPCSPTGEFVEHHYVPGADVRIEDASFPPGAVRCIVETPIETYSRVSPDETDAAITLLVAAMPFGLWPFTRKLVPIDEDLAGGQDSPGSDV